MEFGEYVGKPILAWLWYNPGYEERFGSTNIVCYIYPRVFDNRSFATINAVEDFPENGRIEVFIQGGKSAEEIFQTFGPLVSVRLNKEITPNYKGRNRYRMNYYPQSDTSVYGYNSDISIEHVSENRFFQVVETETDFESVQKAKSIRLTNGKPFTKCILLKIGDTLYGPFVSEYREDGLYLSSSKRYQYQIGEYSWTDYADKTVSILDQEEKPAVKLLPFNALANVSECEKVYDWISDEQLIADLAGALKAGGQYTRTELRKITSSVEKFLESDLNVSLTEDHMKRMKELAQNLSTWNEFTDSLIRGILEDDTAGKTLADAAEAHYTKAVKDKITEYEDACTRVEALQREETEYQRRIKDLQDSEGELTERIRTLTNDSQGALAASQAKEAEQFHKEIERLTNEGEQLRSENQALSERIQAFGPLEKMDSTIQQRQVELDEYNRKIQTARTQYDYEQDQKRKLDEALKAMLRQYQDEAGQVTRLFDMRLLDQILNGTQAPPSQTHTPPVFNPAVLHAPMTREEIIDRVSAYFREKAGRSVSRNDCINYLTCLTQGFITVIAGNPGTGKTTLCHLLAKSLGLETGNEQNRFLAIAVERGWKSQQDFIGFYNLSTNMLEVKNPEIWNALQQLDQEYDSSMSGSVYAPFLMVLDEANLSSPEHYWSGFLRNCDISSSTNRSVSLGGGENRKLPAHLRFLATVNFDHTTEKLSPRFLNRSWVIMLESATIEDKVEDISPNFDDMISYASLKDAFFPTAADLGGIDKEIQEKWNVLQSIFANHYLPIPPRSLKMIRDYCAVTCQCMERNDPETQLAPLDYAFSQKILPAIQGSGEVYKELIYDLKRECKNMALSAGHLERMQRLAEYNHGFYQFFG